MTTKKKHKQAKRKMTAKPLKPRFTVSRGAPPGVGPGKDVIIENNLPDSFGVWPQPDVEALFDILRLRKENAALLEQVKTLEKAQARQHPHTPACNYWTGPIGGPGCICEVVNKHELADLRSKHESQTRFMDFDNPTHPFHKWWQKYGQYMMAGGGRRESIWAARGWIAREQLADGVPVTGESLSEKPLREKEANNERL